MTSMMGLQLFGWVPTLTTIVTVTIAILFGRYQSEVWPRSPKASKVEIRNPETESIKKHYSKTTERKDSYKKNKEVEANDLVALKQLYFQLHNLENFPGVLIQARKLLLSLLEETHSAAHALHDHGSILSVKVFSREGLEAFQHKRNSYIGGEWEEYNQRRKEGGPRDLFEDREEAIWWLKQIAPIKLVDGAWLGYIGKVTAPFALRKTMKGAWQILSEELGDGDLGKNHVHVYHNLLESVAPGFPTPETLDFGHARHQISDLAVWKAAIAQLLISVFPHDFLPEILGYNLHFEAISMDTLKAVRELKEVGIDPYYFILHISIDNAHSGHSAIAIEIVCEYMDYILKSEGREAVDKVWKRLQRGYLLSSGLPGSAICPSRRKPPQTPMITFSSIEEKVTQIFKAKAQVVQGIHCCSRVQIGNRRVSDWLDPVALESKSWQKGLLDALSDNNYWIRKGDSSNSRFIQELQWSGRMFGSFTQAEYNVLRAWVDSLSLALDDPQGDPCAEFDVLYGDPVFPSSSSTAWVESLPPINMQAKLVSLQNLPPLDLRGSPGVEKFMPLWLAHPCLLQSFVAIPSRTNNTFASTVVRILRAQGGFDIEQECVAGIAEFQRPNSLGLVGIGMNMMEQNGLSLNRLPSLKDVLREWPCEFATQMLHLSARPVEYRGLLIGMATAFAMMHANISRNGFLMMSSHDQEVLKTIAQRELDGLELCWQELGLEDKLYVDCWKGYLGAVREIEKCFCS